LEYLQLSLALAGDECIRGRCTLNHPIPAPMKRSLLFAPVLLALVFLATSARSAERGYVDIGKFTPANGCEFVEVNLHAPLLKIACLFIDKDEPEVAALIRSLKHVRVNVVGFDDTNRRDTTDRVRSIRAGLEAQGWSQTVTVQDKGDAQDVAVYVKMNEDNSIDGVVVTVIDMSARQAVFVNVVGNITPEQLAAVGKGLDIQPLTHLSLHHRKAS
jgi:hypothetical protein